MQKMFPPASIALNLDEAEELFALAVVTEDRSPEEHLTLMRFAKTLDEQRDKWTREPDGEHLRYDACDHAAATYRPDGPRVDGWDLIPS